MVRFTCVLAFAAFLGMGPNQVAHAQVKVGGRIVIPAEDFTVSDDADDDAMSVKGSLRSAGGQAARIMRKAVPESSLTVSGSPERGNKSRGDGDRKDRGANFQVNDPALDHITTFSPPIVTRPFEFSTQSETSVVSLDKDVVVGYNSSAGAVIESFPGVGLFFTQLLFSGYSASHDGGQTWTSGFVPPVSPDSPFTFGDPSVAADRRGNIFYASLGTDALGNSAIIINKSTDKGTTFGAAKVVVLDAGSDKEWLAIGPDPRTSSRDNLYITWTSFTGAGSELHLAISTDGGDTWATQTLFAPVDNGITSAFIQFSNPVVDASNGRLYVPFLHLGDTDADYVRVLVSDDGGATFRFLAFNAAGAPDHFALPNVQPGVLNDCGTGGIRNSLHQGPSVGPGRNIGLPTFRYIQATRLITQPAAAAARGRIALALNSSTSPFFGDPSAGSEIRVIVSTDGGSTWTTPLTIAPATPGEPQHVHPAVTMRRNGTGIWVGYYVQQADERLRTDLATLDIDNGRVERDDVAGLSSTAFDLTPSNIPRPTAANPFQTTNYDRSIAQCYDIGEYMSVALRGPGEGKGEGAVAAWGDNRNAWTGPPGSAAPYTHAQADVYFGRVRKGN